MTGLNLRRHVEFRRPDHFRRAAGWLAFRGPCRIVNARMSAARHQFVIGRMKFDLVTPVAARIEGTQLGRVLVGDTPARRHRRRAPMLAELRQLLAGRSPAIGRERINERPVQCKQIDLLERRRLVEHLVGRERCLDHRRFPC